MSTLFSAKVYLVIGSTSGIGLSTANALIDKGAKVAFADVNTPALEDAINSIDSQKRSNALLVNIDITNHESVNNAIQFTKQHFGKLDGIANIAGVGGHHFGKQRIWENGPEEYDFIMSINVRGIFNVLNLALIPGLLETPGSIVHVTSIYSLRGCKNAALYSASKHAAVGLIKSAAIESGSSGIRVNAVLPGTIDTPSRAAIMKDFNARDSTPNLPIPRPGNSAEVANVICFLLGDEAGYVTGAAWSVDGGATA